MTADYSLVLKGLWVFTATVAVSVLWVLYFRYSAEDKDHKAALADVGIVLISMFNVLSYTEDPRLGIPVLLGTYAGTRLGLWYKRREHARS